MKVSRRLRVKIVPPRLPRIAGPLALFVLFCALDPSKALTAERFWVDNSNGLALGGFDPVSYFTHVTPQYGSDEYELVWQGVAWHFENQGNLKAFKRDPEVYAPQFGGLGPVALGKGHRTPGNPRIFLILRGRLYLFYSAGNRAAWQAMSETERAATDVAWQRRE